MTTSPADDSIVAIYETHTGAETAIQTLQQAGMDMKKLSIVARDFHTEEHALGFYTSGDRVKFWGGRGVFWGSLWGLLVGGAFFFIPAIGPVVVMGPFVAWIVSALEGATIGGLAGVLATALTSAGFPKDSAVKYEMEVKAGKFLVLAHGSAEMIGKARAVLGNTGASHLSTSYATRESILNLLSDDEVASVSTAEPAPGLSNADEYLDLERLEQGVQTARGTEPIMGRILPRKGVHDATWAKILAQLAPPPS
jgi:hypothetical protein